MREVHHVHQAEDQTETGRDQRVDQPHQQPADRDLKEDGESHEARGEGAVVTIRGPLGRRCHFPTFHTASSAATSNG